MNPETLTFRSGDADCEAWHWPATTADLAGRAGRPVLVMAHGLACTKDCGLAPFAEAFAAAGLDVLAFDYRGFGNSGGAPRQVVSVDRQVADVHAAIVAAKALPGVDPWRVALWGMSLGGGHVVCAAADRSDVAAVVSAVPLVDGLAAARLAAAHHSPGTLLRSTGRGLRSRARSLVAGGPELMPVVCRPGEVGALSLAGCYEDMLAFAGPTWRNEVGADVVMELGSRRALKAAARLACPWLVQIADFDRSAPPQAAAKAAFRGRAEVRHYPCDHFDLFPGKPWHEPAVEHAVRFLRRHLAVEPAPSLPGSRHRRA